MCFPVVQMISAELRSSKHWELTGEGSEIAGQGSHEARVFNSIPLEGLAQSELMVSDKFVSFCVHMIRKVHLSALYVSTKVTLAIL